MTTGTTHGRLLYGEFRSKPPEVVDYWLAGWDAGD